MNDRSKPTLGDRYFAYIAVIDHARRCGDIATEIECCLECRTFLAVALAEEAGPAHQQRSRTFNIPIFAPLVRYLPVFLAESQLDATLRVATAVERYGDFRDVVRIALEDTSFVREAYQHIQTTPGCVQSEVKKLFPRAADYLYWASAFGYIEKVRSGRSYKLYLSQMPSGTIDCDRLRARTQNLVTIEQRKAMIDEHIGASGRSRLETERMMRASLSGAYDSGSRSSRRSSSGCLVTFGVIALLVVWRVL